MPLLSGIIEVPAEKPIAHVVQSRDLNDHLNTNNERSSIESNAVKSGNQVVSIKIYGLATLRLVIIFLLPLHKKRNISTFELERNVE